MQHNISHNNNKYKDILTKIQAEFYKNAKFQMSLTRIFNVKEKITFHPALLIYIFL